MCARVARVSVVVTCLVAAVSTTAVAQATRAEAIAQARREKTARLWPERQSPMVDQANRLVERGFHEGLEIGRGVNGPQFVLGGMRSGQGAAYGIGYRKSDLWGDRLDFRTTARGTFQTAYKLDASLDFRDLRTSRTFVNLQATYESSPHMDFYGRGPFSSHDDRSSYLLEDLAVDVRAGFDLTRHLRIGGSGGVVDVRTGTPRRTDLPSTGDVFTPEEAPGLGRNTHFDRWGGFAAFDTRDSPTGPRSGGLYGMRYRKYFDRGIGAFDFTQTEIEAQQYLPYRRGTRVVAFRAAASLSFETGQGVKGKADVPVYFMPTMGGNDDLRGFARYRFHDNHGVLLSAEHRWYVFSGLDMALFVDAAKVVPRRQDLSFSNAEVSGGLGFRVRVRDSVVMRIDLAAGNEGFRWMWTFADIYEVPF